MGNILYIEPFSGASGDMLLSALLGLIDDKAGFWKKLKSLPLEEKWEVSLSETSRCGIRANKLNLKISQGKKHVHKRSLKEIEQIIMLAKLLPEKVKKNAVKVFRRLASAEARVHGCETDSVHFHEVGAADAIIDIAGVCFALELIGAEKIITASIPLGGGTVRSAHGVLPVPAPATAELMRGFPVRASDIKAELTTPTGAALLTVLSDGWEKTPEGVLIESSYGAGQKDFAEQPNVLRASLFCGGKTQSSEAVAVIETNIDDMCGEVFSWLGPKLIEKGAWDYALIPATMKKGRPGIILQVLCLPGDLAKLADFILKETSTFGIRYRIENRITLNRKIETIETQWGKIKVKSALDEKGVVLKAKPEFQDCAKLADSKKTGYFSLYKKVSASLEKSRDRKKQED